MINAAIAICIGVYGKKETGPTMSWSGAGEGFTGMEGMEAIKKFNKFEMSF